MTSYVINLKRRSDRKETFTKNYETFGPDIPLIFVDAVDGSVDDLTKLKCLLSKVSFNEYINKNNDYGNNPKISACSISHMKTWSLIANGSDDFALIFEDDVLFREDFKFKKLYKDLEKSIKKLDNETKVSNNKPSIIYFGAGDVLPIHVPSIPNESQLRAAERSHVHQESIKGSGGCLLGIPRKSAYIFEWFGAFSYILTKETAIFLLDYVSKNPINKAIDVFLKDLGDILIINRFATVPLMTYHSSYDLNVYDSDTTGIAIPIIDNTSEINNIPRSITFIIDHYYKLDTLIQTIDSIYKNKGSWIVKIVVCISSYYSEYISKVLDLINEYREGFSTSLDILVYSAYGSRLMLHKNYNNIITSFCKDSDFVAFWSDDIVMSNNDWTLTFNHYLKVLNITDQKPASFRLRLNEAWIFDTLIVNKKFLELLDIFKGPDIKGYLKYISYLSKTCILVRSVIVKQIDSKLEFELPAEKHQEISEMKEQVSKTLNELKPDIINVLNNITNDPNYSSCGIWVNYPKGFEDRLLTDMISELKLFEKGNF